MAPQSSKSGLTGIRSLSEYRSWADPAGHVFKARRPAPLAMRPASRRGAILTQGLENAARPVTNTRTGS